MNAEQLQEHENRGHALASARLALGVSPHLVRSCAHRAYDGHGCVGQMSSQAWRTEVHTMGPLVGRRWAAMAGCELAIEQHEAKQ